MRQGNGSPSSVLAWRIPGTGEPAGLQQHKWFREGSGTHSSTLAWRIPGTEEPGGLQSMGSLRVGHNWASSLSLVTFMHWRRKWQPTPVSLPGESQGWGSPLGCHLWGHTELDTTEVTAAAAAQVINYMSKLSVSHSVISNSLQPHGLLPARFLCPWDSPGNNTGVGSHSFLQGIFLTQGSSPGLLYCRQFPCHLSFPFREAWIYEYCYR